ncbi:hypothetical protein FG386_002528 [Cryptosporidium ryanae]|uniref:uncharacterized protein n=1 Tax=Cryptosporidium ryanae TaxID=515981 RepID=UPI00351A7FF8|nr:hypothetical protein FG386_002528 [Cryptosporidium ryanae]
MKSIYLFIYLLSKPLFLYWKFDFVRAHDTISTKICNAICSNGRVFNPFSPPVEPTCGSYISCSKCNFGTTTKLDPSTVCLNVFSTHLSNYGEEQITLFHGKSHLLISHSSTYSRLSKEENVRDLKEGGKKHGLFTLSLDWERIKGVDASKCENGIAEVEWTLYNTGVYRNWDITAIIETRPEATFPFCFENVEVPLDTTRSTTIGRKIPTNLKRLGSRIKGTPNAIRITKIIAVNQPEMKLNPTKTLALLLEKYISFRIMINNVDVKQIYLHSFHEKNELKSENDIASDSDSSNKETSASSLEESLNNRSLRKYAKVGLIKTKNSLNKFAEKVYDEIRGKSYTEPLILDSSLSLGFYSCFRVLCNRKKYNSHVDPLKLKSKIPLSIITAREVHNEALKEHLPLIPLGHTIPLPIYKSEYWACVREEDKPECESKKIQHLKYDKYSGSITLSSINETIPDIDLIKVDSTQNLTESKDVKLSKKGEGEFTSEFMDILALIAITNSEVLENDVIVDGIIKSDSLGETE